MWNVECRNSVEIFERQKKNEVNEDIERKIQTKNIHRINHFAVMRDVMRERNSSKAHEGATETRGAAASETRGAAERDKQADHIQAGPSLHVRARVSEHVRGRASTPIYNSLHITRP